MRLRLPLVLVIALAAFLGLYSVTVSRGDDAPDSALAPPPSLPATLAPARQPISVGPGPRALVLPAPVPARREAPAPARAAPRAPVAERAPAARPVPNRQPAPAPPPPSSDEGTPFSDVE